MADPEKIPVASLREMERLYKEGVASQDDYQEFIDGLLGYGPPWQGWIYPNLPEIRKEQLGKRVT